MVFTGLARERLLGSGLGLGGGFFLGRRGFGAGGHLSLSCVKLKIRLISGAHVKPRGASNPRQTLDGDGGISQPNASTKIIGQPGRTCTRLRRLPEAHHP